MKILYLKLTNFINIVTAFNTETIEIDFSKSNNNVVLLTGPNGSGKTSILSCLHPFPTNGNMDVRSNNPIIVPKENGYFSWNDNRVIAWLLYRSPSPRASQKTRIPTAA